MNHTILIHDLKEKLLDDMDEAHDHPCSSKKTINNEFVKDMCEQRRKAHLST